MLIRYELVAKWLLTCFSKVRSIVGVENSEQQQTSILKANISVSTAEKESLKLTKKSEQTVRLRYRPFSPPSAAPLQVGGERVQADPAPRRHALGELRWGNRARRGVLFRRRRDPMFFLTLRTFFIFYIFLTFFLTIFYFF